jgi:energy-coupling factor transporter ATP-binding protein EcfA2
MNLLTRIAKDRLVIMVTHNNELAEEYANRIVRLKDGQVASDSNPFDPPSDFEFAVRDVRKASMSFITAISLSFSNLMTKKGRTFVTSLAGSIGIVGIATILALATGINLYIQRMEEETLSLYPLMIQTTGFNLSNMFGGGDNDDTPREPRPEIPPDHVREFRIVDSFFSAIHINDLESLKAYFEEYNDVIQSHVQTIHYMYDITPQIFLTNTPSGIEQVNPDEIFANSGMGGMADGGMAGLGFGMPGMNNFHEMPNELSLFANQYEILKGRWPENFDEAVIVLSHGSGISDFELYSLGLRDRRELSSMLDSFMTGTEMEFEVDTERGIFSYETLMSVEFKVITPAD